MPDSWALKGDARMFGYTPIADEALGAPQALSATQGKPFKNLADNKIYEADIHQGANQVPLDFTQNVDVNLHVDNRVNAYVGDLGQACTALINGPFSPAPTRVLTSYEPVFLSYDQLDLVGPRQMSHKLFAHLSLICDRDVFYEFELDC